MPRASRITSRQLWRALRALGWTGLDWTAIMQRGSHVHLIHPDRPGRVTVPVHAGETLKPKTLLRFWTRRG
jgi:predicted RNA binding protein YcfA (HicA-like mRNA interferase family)